MNRTDWNQYYKKPYKTAVFSRIFTGNKIVKLIKKHFQNNMNQIRIVELGGANSCFYNLISETIKPTTYTIIDNNQLGLKKFAERVRVDASVGLECLDILDIGKETRDLSQIVFSVGLIEHFSIEDTARAISAHFRFIEKDGICIITFPTPTWLYKISRKISEMLRMWIFWDERPLKFEEVEKEVNRHATILHKSITWPIFFTQGVIVAKKK